MDRLLKSCLQLRHYKGYSTDKLFLVLGHSQTDGDGFHEHKGSPSWRAEKVFEGSGGGAALACWQDVVAEIQLR